MEEKATSKFEGDVADLYVELSGELYDICQKYGKCGDIDEVIHHNEAFEKLVNGLEDFIILQDKTH